MCLLSSSAFLETYQLQVNQWRLRCVLADFINIPILWWLLGVPWYENPMVLQNPIILCCQVQTSFYWHYLQKRRKKLTLLYFVISPTPGSMTSESPLTCWSVLAAIKVKSPLGPEQSHLYLQHLQIKQLLLILTALSAAKISFPKEQVEKRWRIATEHFPLGMEWREGWEEGTSLCCGDRCPAHSGVKCGGCLFSAEWPGTDHGNLLNLSYLLNKMNGNNNTWSTRAKDCRSPKRSYTRKCLYF